MQLNMYTHQILAAVVLIIAATLPCAVSITCTEQLDERLQCVNFKAQASSSCIDGQFLCTVQGSLFVSSPMSCNIVQCAGLSIQEVIEDPASGIESSWWSAPGEEDVMITLDLDPSCSENDTHEERFQWLGGYITITFASRVPRSMIIERSSDGGKTFSPWQFYAPNCAKVPNAFLPCISMEIRSAPFRAVISLSAFPSLSLLRDPRTDPNLAENLRADTIRLHMLQYTRLPGDGVSDDERVYGVEDIQIAALCECHNHASECLPKDCEVNQIPTCVCQDNTIGRNCQRCARGFQAMPWQPGPGNVCESCPCLPGSTTPVVNSKSPEATCIDIHGQCPCIHPSIKGSHCSECADGYFAPPYDYHATELEEVLLNDGVVGLVKNTPDATIYNLTLSSYWWSGRGYVVLSDPGDTLPFSALILNNTFQFSEAALQAGLMFFIEYRAVNSTNISFMNGSEVKLDATSNSIGRLEVHQKGTLQLLSGGPIFIDRIIALPASYVSLDALKVSHHLDFPRVIGLRELVPETCDIFVVPPSKHNACTELAFVQSMLAYGQCFPCECSIHGTIAGGTCNPLTGQCVCRKNAVGRRCDNCKLGYYMTSNGCVPCNCKPMQDEVECQCHRPGTIDAVCGIDGSCMCKPPYTGPRCSECIAEAKFDPSIGACVLCTSCALVLKGKAVCDTTIAQHFLHRLEWHFEILSEILSLNREEEKTTKLILERQLAYNFLSSSSLTLGQNADVFIDSLNASEVQDVIFQLNALHHRVLRLNDEIFSAQSLLEQYEQGVLVLSNAWNTIRRTLVTMMDPAIQESMSSILETSVQRVLEFPTVISLLEEICLKGTTVSTRQQQLISSLLADLNNILLKFPIDTILSELSFTTDTVALVTRNLRLISASIINGNSLILSASQSREAIGKLVSSLNGSNVRIEETIFLLNTTRKEMQSVSVYIQDVFASWESKGGDLSLFRQLKTNALVLLENVTHEAQRIDNKVKNMTSATILMMDLFTTTVFNESLPIAVQNFLSVITRLNAINVTTHSIPGRLHNIVFLRNRLNTSKLNDEITDAYNAASELQVRLKAHLAKAYTLQDQLTASETALSPSNFVDINDQGINASLFQTTVTITQAQESITFLESEVAFRDAQSISVHLLPVSTWVNRNQNYTSIGLEQIQLLNTTMQDMTNTLTDDVRPAVANTVLETESTSSILSELEQAMRNTSLLLDVIEDQLNHIGINPHHVAHQNSIFAIQSSGSGLFTQPSLLQQQNDSRLAFTVTGTAFGDAFTDTEETNISTSGFSLTIGGALLPDVHNLDFADVPLPFSFLSLQVCTGFPGRIQAQRISAIPNQGKLYAFESSISVWVQVFSSSNLSMGKDISTFVAAMSVGLTSHSGPTVSLSSCVTRETGNCVAEIMVPNHWRFSHSNFTVTLHALLENVTESEQLTEETVFSSLEFVPVPPLDTNQEDLILDVPLHTVTLRETFCVTLRSIYDRAVKSFVGKIMLPTGITLLEIEPANPFHLALLHHTFDAYGRASLVVSGIRQTLGLPPAPIHAELLLTLKLQLVNEPDTGTAAKWDFEIGEVIYVTGWRFQDVPKQGLLASRNGYLRAPQTLTWIAEEPVALVAVAYRTNLTDLRPVSTASASTRFRIHGITALGSDTDVISQIQCQVNRSSGLRFSNGELIAQKDECLKISLTERPPILAPSEPVAFSLKGKQPTYTYLQLRRIKYLELTTDVSCIRPVIIPGCTDVFLSEHVGFSLTATLSDDARLDVTSVAMKHKSVTSEKQALHVFFDAHAELRHPELLTSELPSSDRLILAYPIPDDIHFAGKLIHIEPASRVIDLRLDAVNLEDILIEAVTDVKVESNTVRDTDTITLLVSYPSQATFRVGGASKAVIQARILLDSGAVLPISPTSLSLHVPLNGFEFIDDGVIFLTKALQPKVYTLVFGWLPGCAEGANKYALMSHLNVTVTNLEGWLSVKEQVIHLAQFGEAAGMLELPVTYQPQPIAHYRTSISGRYISIHIKNALTSGSILTPKDRGIIINFHSNGGVVVNALQSGDHIITIQYFGLEIDIVLLVVRSIGFTSFFVPFPHPFTSEVTSANDWLTARMVDPQFCRVPASRSISNFLQGQAISIIALSNGTNVVASPGTTAEDVEFLVFSNQILDISFHSTRHGGIHVSVPAQMGISNIGVRFSTRLSSMSSRVTNQFADISSLRCNVVRRQAKTYDLVQCDIEMQCASTAFVYSAEFLEYGQQVHTPALHTQLAFEDYISMSIADPKYSSAFSFNASRGTVHAQQNTPFPIPIRIQSTFNPDVFTTVYISGNLAPSFLDIDIGSDGDVAIQPLNDGEIVEVPVRVNTRNEVLGAFDIEITVDTALRIVGHTSSAQLLSHEVVSNTSYLQIAGFASAKNPELLHIRLLAYTISQEDLIATISVNIRVLATISYEHIIQNRPSITSHIPVLVRYNSNTTASRERRDRTLETTAAFLTPGYDPLPPTFVDCTYFDFFVIQRCPDPVACGVEIPGDVNGDCRVSVLDVGIIFTYMKEKAIDFATDLGSRLQQLANAVDLHRRADIDHSGIVMTADARLLLLALVGKARLASFSEDVKPTQFHVGANLVGNGPTIQDIRIYAVIASTCPALLNLNFDIRGDSPTFIAKAPLLETEGKSPLQPLYAQFVPLKVLNSTMLALHTTSEQVQELTSMGISFIQISRSGVQVLFASDTSFQRHFQRFSARVIPFNNTLVGLFIDGHSPLLSPNFGTQVLTDGVYPYVLPNFMFQSREPITTADTVITTRRVRGSFKCMAYECAYFCIQLGSECRGFKIAVDSVNRATCVLYRAVELAERELPKDSASYIRSIDIDGTGLSSDGMDLLFEGATMSNIGDARRFSTAFSDEALLSSHVGMSETVCIEKCIVNEACLGVFLWTVSGVHRCRLLNNVGSLSGIETTTNSRSFAKKMDDIISDDNFEVVHIGRAALLASFNASHREFETAFSPTAFLQQEFLTTLPECLDLCSVNSQCHAAFILLQNSGLVCRLLRRIGSSTGIATTVPSLSIRKKVVRNTPEGFELISFGSMYRIQDPLRFSTAFEHPEAVIRDVQDVTSTECAMECLINDTCVGMFLWMQTGPSLTCRLLNHLGFLVPATVASFSYRRLNISSIVLPGYVLEFEGITSTNMGGLPLRFGNAFLPQDQLSSTTVQSIKACAKLCNIEHKMPDVCVGFFVYAENPYRCVTLSNLGVASETSRHSYSFRVADPFKRIGYTPAFSATSNRFSTAFKSQAVLQVAIFSSDFDSSAFQCAKQCNMVQQCTGIFLFILENANIECRLLNDIGEPDGIPTNITSKSFIKLNTINTTSSRSLSTATFISATIDTTNPNPLLSYPNFQLEFQFPRRFSTGVANANALIVQLLVDISECGEACRFESSCVGFFWYTMGGVDRCRLLSNLGTNQGVSTSLESFSFRKL